MNVEAMQIRARRAVTLESKPQWQPGRARLRRRLYLSLIALDVLCIIGSMLLTAWLYRTNAAWDQAILLTTVLLPVYIVTAFNARAYAAEVMVRTGTGITRAVQSFVLAAGIVILVAFYLKASADFSRLVMAGGSLLSIFSLIVVRRQFLRRARTLVGGNPYSVAMISDGNHGLHVSDASFVIHADSDLDPDQDCPVMFDRLATALRDADRVVVACPPERRLSWVRMLKGANIRSEIIATELDAMAPLGLDRFGEFSTMIVAEGPLGKLDSVMKRVFDILVSAGALIALSPLLVVIGVLVKLSSPGPVFFVQTRIGQCNRLFRMRKFRSMRVERGDILGHRSASRDDDRITPIGRFIRSTSIDELPQLINVLLGDMSIVGPRPHALGSRAEDKLFWEVDGRYWHRHAAKPGLTGLAQVRGFRGATERVSDLTNRLQADLEYLHNWSLWRDITIILQTFRVLIHRNAY
ncbi:MAG: sugar transferase [Alphaproteobacteria bacterium HGW-Alphaproteobacteria-16]|nr:MAG: sugar transferase [Alphaproteobacteria bacterium HGW-Alphaproteobacteria-16]